MACCQHDQAFATTRSLGLRRFIQRPFQICRFCFFRFWRGNIFNKACYFRTNRKRMPFNTQQSRNTRGERYIAARKVIALTSISVLLACIAEVDATQNNFKFTGESPKFSGSSIPASAAHGQMPSSYQRRTILQRCLEWLSGSDDIAHVQRR